MPRGARESKVHGFMSPALNYVRRRQTVGEDTHEIVEYQLEALSALDLMNL